jgi:hypothetical protein
MQVRLKREPGLVELVPGNRTLCFTTRYKLPIKGSSGASDTNSSTAAIARVGATDNIGPHTQNRWLSMVSMGYQWDTHFIIAVNVEITDYH